MVANNTIEVSNGVEISAQDLIDAAEQLEAVEGNSENNYKYGCVASNNVVLTGDDYQDSDAYVNIIGEGRIGLRDIDELVERTETELQSDKLFEEFQEAFIDTVGTYSTKLYQTFPDDDEWDHDFVAVINTSNAMKEGFEKLIKNYDLRYVTVISSGDVSRYELDEEDEGSAAMFFSKRE